MPIKRFILLLSLTGFVVLAVLIAAYEYAGSSRRAGDSRIFRGRSLLDTENYLSAADVLRDVPVGGANGPEAHTYLGAAYLRLHLYQAAIREFEEAVRLRSSVVDGWLGLASAYIQVGDSQKALEPASKATNLENKSADAWIILGRANWLQGSFGEAEKDASTALQIEPDNAVAAELLLHIYFDLNQPEKFEPLLDKQKAPSQGVQDLAAQFFLRQGQFVRAWEHRSRFEKRNVEREAFQTELALKRNPQNADLAPTLIRDLIKLERADEAIQIAASNRGSTPLDMEMGKAYLIAGRNSDAIQSLERASNARSHKLSAEVALAAITRDPRHWQEAFRAERIERDYFVLSRLEDVLKTASAIEKAFIYRYAGIYDAYFYNLAAQSALDVLNTQPSDYDALVTISTAYQRLGRIPEAQRYLERAREIFPNRAEPWSRLSNLVITQGNPQTAMQYMQKAIQFDPTNAGDLYNLGWMYDQSGDMASATSYYERAIKASPLSFEAMNNLSLIYQSHGQAEKAKSLLQQAADLDPQNEAVYLNLANYYWRQHDASKALDNYRRAFDANPANPIAAIEMGRIYLERGEAEQALEKLNLALDLDPNSVDAYMALSSTYEKLGRPKEAAAALEEVKRIRPTTAEPGKESN